MKLVRFAAAMALTVAGVTHATADGVNVGTLSCKVGGGMGFIFGSSKELTCTFDRAGGGSESYSGTIDKYGVDIGFTSESHIIWAVFAPGDVAPGSLAGKYGGVQGSAAVGIGLGANVLVGGGNDQFTLQPVSLEGGMGLNVAAGVAQITLVSGR